MPAGPTELVAGIEGFARSVERILVRRGGNTVFSPTGVAVAFAMAAAGARGRTVDDIARVFGFPDRPALHEAVRAVTAVLEGAGPGFGSDDVDIALASAIWAQAGMDIRPGFVDTLAGHYGAGVRTTDFVGDPAGSRRAINGWVAEATRARIPELLGRDAITDDTRVMLVNAVYLRAAWSRAFPPDATADRPFHRADGSTVEVPTMRAAGVPARYGSGDGYTAVELPYVGGELAMLVVVPSDRSAGPPALGEVAAGLRSGRVDLALPRWETDAAVDMGPVLTELGLPVPGGDLGGIASALEIGVVAHAATITVDENGTEAAAATAVGVELVSARTDRPVEVTVDRPFLFAVRHVGTGAPLFVGRVMDPSA